MPDVKSEDRSWGGPEVDAAIEGLKEGIGRLRAHVRVFRRVAACEPHEPILQDDKGQGSTPDA